VTVVFEPSNASAYFNVTAPGADSAMFVGSTSGSRFSGPVTVSGPHVAQVYLMRNVARHNGTAEVPCIGSEGVAQGRCKAGVMRRWARMAHA
jgi:hypothetical protein